MFITIYCHECMQANLGANTLCAACGTKLNERNLIVSETPNKDIADKLLIEALGPDFSF